VPAQPESTTPVELEVPCACEAPGDSVLAFSIVLSERSPVQPPCHWLWAEAGISAAFRRPPCPAASAAARPEPCAPPAVGSCSDADVTAYIVQIRLSILQQGVPPGQLAVVCVPAAVRRRLLATDETRAERELLAPNVVATSAGRRLLAPDVVEIRGKCCQNVTIPPPPGTRTVAFSVDDQCDAGGAITVRGHCPGYPPQVPTLLVAWRRALAQPGARARPTQSPLHASLCSPAHQILRRQVRPRVRRRARRH
jgi:hypothetical protein